MFYASGDHVHYIEVIEAREQKLRAMIRAFQDEQDSGKSQHHGSESRRKYSAGTTTISHAVLERTARPETVHEYIGSNFVVMYRPHRW